MNAFYTLVAGMVLGWNLRAFFVLWRAERRLRAAERRAADADAVRAFVAAENVRPGELLIVKDGRVHCRVSPACPPLGEGERK